MAPARSLGAWLLLAALASTAEWAPARVTRPRIATPTIDGVVAADEWEAARRVRDFTDPWAYDAIAKRWTARYAAEDLACRIRLGHDGVALYLLAEVRDDRIYAVDTPEWQPTSGRDRRSPYWRTPEGTRSGYRDQHWGWWGDCVELALSADPDGGFEEFPYTGCVDPERPGACWKFQANASYRRLMTGRTCDGWRQRGLRCAVRLGDEPRGYVTEWRVPFDPSLTTADGTPVDPAAGEPIGMQLIVLDCDREADGEGHWSNIRHQAVYSYSGEGGKKDRVNWATLILSDQPREAGAD